MADYELSRTGRTNGDALFTVESADWAPGTPYSGPAGGPVWNTSLNPQGWRLADVVNERWVIARSPLIDRTGGVRVVARQGHRWDNSYIGLLSCTPEALDEGDGYRARRSSNRLEIDRKDNNGTINLAQGPSNGFRTPDPTESEGWIEFSCPSSGAMEMRMWWVDAGGVPDRTSRPATADLSATDTTYTTGVPGCYWSTSSSFDTRGLPSLHTFEVTNLTPSGSTVDPASLRTTSRLSAPTLTPHTLLTPASMRTSARVSAPTASQASTVAPASLRTSSRLTLASLTQANTVAPDGLRTSARLVSAALTQASTIGPASMRTTSRLAEAALTQAAQLAPASLRTSSRLSAPLLGFGVNLTPASMRASSRLSAVSLTQATTLAPASLRTLARLSEAALVEAAQLAPDGLRTSSRLSAAVLLTEGVLGPASMRTSARLSAPSLTQANTIGPASMRTSARVSEPALTAASLTLVPASLRTVSRLSAVSLAQAHVLSPEGLRTASRLSSPLLMLGGVLDVASMRTRTRLGDVDLEGGVLIVGDDRLFVVTVDDRVFEVLVDDRVFRPAADGSMEA